MMNWLTVMLLFLALVTAYSPNVWAVESPLPPLEDQQANPVSVIGATGQDTWESGQSAGQSGQVTGRSGQAPGQSGQATIQSGQANGESVQTTGQSGQANSQSGQATGQSGETTGQSGQQANQNSSQPVQNGTTSSQEEAVDTDESLADFIYNQFAGNRNTSQASTASSESTTASPTVATPATSHGATANNDCSLDLPLDNFCEVPQVVRDYFEGVVTLATVVEKLYEPTFLAALDGYECPDGEWCLPDEYREIIKSDVSEFYTSSPFCTSGMTHCVANILQQQSGCAGLAQYRILTFLNETLELLCDERFSTGLDGDCFASTLEILYITFEDVQRGNNVLAEHQDDLQRNDCNPYLVEMTKTYLCADEDCDSFGSKEMLTRFPEWQGMPDRAVDIQESCNITVVCESSAYQEYDEMTEDEYLEAVEEELEEEIEEVEEEKEQYEDVEGMTGGTEGVANEGTSDTYDTTDRPGFLYGMLALALVVVLTFVAVAVVSYKRILRRDRYYDYSRYNKLDTDEETRMLAHAFN